MSVVLFAVVSKNAENVEEKVKNIEIEVDCSEYILLGR